MATKEARNRATQKYTAANIKQIKLALNRKTDADIIEHLASIENINGYLKDLIRSDIK